MKFLRVLLFTLLALPIVTGCAPKQTTTIENGTVIAHIRVEFLNENPTIIGSEEVAVEKHIYREFNRLTGQEISHDCWLTFPGKDYGSANLSDVALNAGAKELVENANAILAGFGGPFAFEFSTGSVWNTSCEATDIYIDTGLSSSYGQRAGPGFLSFKNIKGQEEAWIYIPTAFYDFILKAAVKGSIPDFTELTYPDISEVGGFRILPDDPNGVEAWLNEKVPFLERVYGRSTETEITQARYDYTTTTQESYISGYGCQNYNYKGVCVNRGPNYERYTQEHQNQIDVLLGTVRLK